jgi:hypothetical protein
MQPWLLRNDVVTTFIPVLKDEEREHPVPSAWRETLAAIVEALANGNSRLVDLDAVKPLDEVEAGEIAESIKSYGATLSSLAEESWATSVCRWQVGYWQVLVDLFTVEEGLSDLVLDLRVYENGAEYGFEVYFVYVP